MRTEINLSEANVAMIRERAYPTGARAGLNLSRAATELMDEHAALIGEGYREACASLTPRELEAVMRGLESVAIDASSLTVAALDVAEQAEGEGLPGISGKLRDLSPLARAALAHESLRRKSGVQRDRVASGVRKDGRPRWVRKIAADRKTPSRFVEEPIYVLDPDDEVELDPEKIRQMMMPGGPT